MFWDGTVLLGSHCALNVLSDWVQHQHIVEYMSDSAKATHSGHGEDDKQCLLTLHICMVAAADLRVQQCCRQHP